MSPVWTIARAECRHLARDGRFRTVGVVIAALIAAAAATTIAGVRIEARDREAAARAMRRQWDGQPSRNPHGSAHYGMYAFRPVGGLAGVDPGVDAYLGAAMYLEAHHRNPVRYRPAEDRTSLARVGAMPAATVLQFGLPLLVIALAHGVIAGERSAGTLRHVLGSGVSPATYVAGKALGLVLATGAVAAPALMIAGLTGLASGAPPGRVTGLLAGYGVFAAAWLALSILVSSRASSSRSSLVMLLAFWSVSTVGVPLVASSAASRLHPVPSADTFWAAIEHDMERGFQAHAGQTPQFVAFRTRLLQQYGVERVEDLPVGFWGVVYLEAERHADAVYDRHYDRLKQVYAGQQAVLRWSAMASPLLAVRAWSAAMAGSDLWHGLHFADAAETYRRDVNVWLNEHLATHGRGTAEYFADREFWRTLPAFGYVPPAFSWAATQAAWDLALLAAAVLLATVGLVLTAGRLRP